MRWGVTLAFLTMLLCLGGCGGKSSTGGGKGPLPVAVASADPAMVGSLGGQVTLRGVESRAPGGRPLIFHWSQVMTNPLPVVFSANDSRDAFVVQVFLRVLGASYGFLGASYGFVLVVENDQGVMSIPDSVVVNVSPPDWAATDNPCGSDFLNDPQAVDRWFAEIGAELRAEGVSDSDWDQYADGLDADADLNEENGLLGSAERLRCKAWLVRHLVPSVP